MLAGTGTDAHKVAYVKTVFHDDVSPCELIHLCIGNVCCRIILFVCVLGGYVL